eukprot:g2146.t1
MGPAQPSLSGIMLLLAAFWCVHVDVYSSSASASSPPPSQNYKKGGILPGRKPDRDSGGNDNSISRHAAASRSSRFLERVERATDGADDGQLGSDEIEQYIKLAVGGEHFDDDIEVENGALNALNNIDTTQRTRTLAATEGTSKQSSTFSAVSSSLPSSASDGYISLSELRQYWASLKTLSTPEEVAEWVVHSVRLPQYAETFLRNAVTGFDLPLLLQDQGKILIELGVDTSLHRRVFERAINMRLFGIAKEPNAVPLLEAYILQECLGVELVWKPAASGGIKVHRYQIERSSIMDPEDMKSLSNRAPDSAVSMTYEERRVYSGESRSAVFAGLSPEQSYIFRIRAFNALGMGAWSNYIKVEVPAVCSNSRRKTIAGIVQSSSMKGASTLDTGRQGADQKGAGGCSEAPCNWKHLPSATINENADKVNVEKTTHGRNDMKLRRDEIEQFIRKLGGESFDEANEVGNGADRIFDSIDTDGGGNGIITLEELSRFWSSGSPEFSTSRDVADWVEFALLLPQYREPFERHTIVPNDLSLLIADRGHLLRSMIGVNNTIHHAKIMRAIKMRLFGLGQTPVVASDIICKKIVSPGQGVTLSWHMLTQSGSAGSADSAKTAADTSSVHKFRYRRRSGVVLASISQNTGASTGRAKEHTWNYFVFDDESLEIRGGRYSAIDAFVPEKDMRIEYQIQAWNSYGASQWSNSEICFVPGHGIGPGREERKTSNMTVWGVLERFSAYLNTLSFIGQIILVLVTVALSIAPPAVRVSLNTHIQQLPELVANMAKKAWHMKRRFENSPFGQISKKIKEGITSSADANDIALEMAEHKTGQMLLVKTGPTLRSDDSDGVDSERENNVERRQKRASSLGKNVLQGRVDLVKKAQGNTVSVTAGSSHRQSSLDMNSFTELQKVRKPKCCGCVVIINPLSLRHSVWDLFVAFILVISLVTLPLGMAFDDIANSLFSANLLFDIVFAMDITVTFCTGFIDANDVLIMNPIQIAKNYLASWFVLDVVSSIPIDAILRIVEASQIGQQADGTDIAKLTKTFKMVRLIRMAKLLRLFRLSRVAKYVRSARLWLEHHLKFEMPIAVIKVSKLLVLLCFLGHWLGCVFFFIPKQFEFPPNSWVVRGGIADLTTGEQYGWSLLKALYMMIGGEEMLPSGNSIGCEDTSEYCAVESWMTLISLYLGATFSALLISEVSLIVTSLDKSRLLFHDRLKAVNEYMRANKLSPELREHVREYFGLRYSDQKMFHEDAILRDLSPNLQVRIREEMSHNIIECVPLLHDQSDNHAFIDNLVTKLRGPLICFPQEVIFYEGTMGHSMYFIYSGVVGIYSSYAPCDDDNTDANQLGSIVAAISNGCYFGEVAMLMKCRRTASARSETITSLHTLSDEALDICLDDAPAVREYMMKIATTRRQRVNQMSPDYSGIVDSSLESPDYFDAEDAKTQVFQFQNSKLTTQAYRDSSNALPSPTRSKRKRRTSKLFEFDKSVQMDRKAGESFKALQRATSKAVRVRRLSFKGAVKLHKMANSSVNQDKAQEAINTQSEAVVPAEQNSLQGNGVISLKTNVDGITRNGGKDETFNEKEGEDGSGGDEIKYARAKNKDKSEKEKRVECKINDRGDQTGEVTAEQTLTLPGVIENHTVKNDYF